MRLKRLKLAGFKSFVEPTELKIENGLTGIVGPNGCGKSNLLEAIRWVMGESSPKSMRGGGMEDVIFAGTASRPQREFAEVSLLAERDVATDAPGFIANDDDHEVEVTRRIERGAGSAYRANGRDVRAKDVALIDNKSHIIIIKDSNRINFSSDYLQFIQQYHYILTVTIIYVQFMKRVFIVLKSRLSPC